MPVMGDELHHRAESQGLREAVLPLPVKDLDQLVIASLPAVGSGEERTRIITPAWVSREPQAQGRVPTALPQRSRGSRGPYRSVSVYSPWILLEASRTKNVPSGVSRSFSFTSSLRGM